MLAREDRDALLAVVVVDERRDELAGKRRAPIPSSGNDDRHRASVRGQRGGDLGADEAAADHRDARSPSASARVDGG